MIIISTIVALAMASLVFLIRMRSSTKPVNTKKILLPPLFMSTGFSMFLIPYFRLPIMEGLEAFIVGVLFSLFLIKTSSFEVVQDNIYLKRSKAFIFILVGLIVVRLLLKVILGQFIPVHEMGGLFFTLAFGMILPWRIAMFFMYRNLAKKLALNKGVVLNSMQQI